MSKVKLHQRLLKAKNEANLYFDFYPAIVNPVTGLPTRRYNLGLHIIATPANESEIDFNAKVMAMAEKRKLEVQLMVYQNDFSFFTKDPAIDEAD